MSSFLIALLKSENYYQLLTFLAFQTHNTFIHLRNTNEDIFNEAWEISVHPLHFHAAKTLTLQKVDRNYKNNPYESRSIYI